MRSRRTLALVALGGLALAVTVAVAVQMLRDSANEATPGPAGGGSGGVAATDAAGANLDVYAAGVPLPAQDMADVAPEASGQNVASPAGQQQPPGQVLDRKIAMNGDMELQVKDVGGAFEDISRIAASTGGFVSGSTFGYRGEDQIASLTIRVPTDRFQDALAQVRRLAEKVDSEQATSQDLTEQYTDLQSQLRNLQATEQRYLDLLGRAQSVGDILQLEDRLASVRGQIEQTQGRINLIDHTADMATLTAHLSPAGAAAQVEGSTGGGPHPLRAAGEAWEASLTVLGSIASGLLVVVVFSWWLVPLLALAAVAAVRLLRSRRAQPASGTATP